MKIAFWYIFLKQIMSPHKFWTSLLTTLKWYKHLSILVATLALGSWPKQKLTRAWAKREARECGRVWEWTLTLPNELPFWKLESRWTPESSESDCKGQNPSHWKFPYINGKLLEHRCLKWARMTHLDIWNTSYGQK
jgi:hypothetical protein